MVIKSRKPKPFVMQDHEELKILLLEILQAVKSSKSSKYLTANQVEEEYGINVKTVLNRSNLPATHKRHIPSVHIQGGRQKYFERILLDRLFTITKTKQEK